MGAAWFEPVRARTRTPWAAHARPNAEAPRTPALHAAGRIVDVYVLKRPFVDHFLRAVGQRFEVRGWVGGWLGWVGQEAEEGRMGSRGGGGALPAAMWDVWLSTTCGPGLELGARVQRPGSSLCGPAFQLSP